MFVFSVGPDVPMEGDENTIDSMRDYDDYMLFSTMIPTPNGQGVIALGMKNDPKQIYQLSWKENSNELQWSKIGQLKSPRTNPVAMWIPNDLANCTIQT